MRTSLTLVLLVLLLLNILAGCAPGAKKSAGTASEHDAAGFWLGLWHGFIAPFVFVVSLFKSNLSIYEVHNNGLWYNFGYLCGVACFFGGGGNKTARRNKSASKS